MEVLQEFHVRQVLSASMTHVTIVTLLLAELIVLEFVSAGTSQFTDIFFCIDFDYCEVYIESDQPLRVQSTRTAASITFF